MYKCIINSEIKNLKICTKLTIKLNISLRFIEVEQV